MTADYTTRQRRLLLTDLPDDGIFSIDDRIGVPSFDGSTEPPDSTAEADMEIFHNSGCQHLEAMAPTYLQPIINDLYGSALLAYKKPAPYNATRLFPKGGMCLSIDNRLFVSLVDGNINNPLTDATKWLQITTSTKDALFYNNTYNFIGTWSADGTTLTLKPASANAPTVIDDGTGKPTINNYTLPQGFLLNCFIETANNVQAVEFNIVFTDYNDNTTYTQTNGFHPYVGYTPPNCLYRELQIYYYGLGFKCLSTRSDLYQFTSNFSGSNYTGRVIGKYLINGGAYVEEMVNFNANFFDNTDKVDYTTNQLFTQYTSISTSGVNMAVITYGNANSGNGLLSTPLDVSTHSIRFRSLMLDSNGLSYNKLPGFFKICGFIA